MATACTCDSPVGNTGVVSCIDEIKDIRGGFLWQMTKSDGTPNEIDLSAPINAALFTALINDPDTSARIYPLPELKNFTPTLGEQINETFEDGDIKKVQDGQDSFEVITKQGVPAMAEAYNKFGCKDVGIIQFDSTGKLVGDISEAGKLRPMRFSSNTFTTKYQYATATTTAHLQFNWVWHRNLCVDQIGFVSSSDLNGVDVFELEGLIDAIVSGTPTPLATSVTVSLVTKYGSAVSPIKVMGADNTADWSVNEISPTPGAIAITSVVESPDGTYEISFASQTSGDVLSVDLVKDGYEMTQFQVTIP